MNNVLADWVDRLSFYLASSFDLRLFDGWELVMSLVALVLALAWLMSAKISFRPEQLQWLNRFLGYAKTGFLILVALIIARGSFLEPVRVASNELQPEFNDGQLVVVEKISWGIRLPMSNRLFNYGTAKRNDIVMINHLNRSQRKVESRMRKIIAMAGDKVLVDFSKSSASIEHNNQKFSYSFQGLANKSDEVLAFVVPKHKMLLATNKLRAQNFSNPEYVTLKQIVGTPKALPF